MHTRFAVLAGGALLATCLGFTAASDLGAEQSRSAQKSQAAPAPQKAAAVSMVVYKSQT